MLSGWLAPATGHHLLQVENLFFDSPGNGCPKTRARVVKLGPEITEVKLVNLTNHDPLLPLDYTQAVPDNDYFFARQAVVQK
jgi:hypothetical protein